jgi:succinylglutamic semialdehyde dehydrogenase
MTEMKGNYIGGDWIDVPSSDGRLERFNPAKPSEKVFEGSWSRLAVDQAVKEARQALSDWDRKGLEERKAYLRTFAGILEDRQESLATTIAREAGKPLWEARKEASALVSKIEVMTDLGAEYIEERQPRGLENGRYRYRPLGVMAVLGPFNFPLHLPNGHIVPALLAGNTVVVKPSEMAPGSMQLYFECFEKAGFPDGVANLVQGPGEVGAELSGHRGVNGVLFTGSHETGSKIQEATRDDYWKLLALEMGGKNTAIVLNDANLDQAAYEAAVGAYLTTGQRCSATNRIVVQSDVFDDFLERFIEITKQVTVGDPMQGDPFMGPLINESAFDRFMEAQEDDEAGNLVPVVRGGEAEVPNRDGYFVRPGIWQAAEVDATGSHQGQEIFGPDVVFYEVNDDKNAARVANATEYGLSMSCFTADRERFEELSYQLQTGVLNLNRSTCRASSRLPFGGLKKSGNHRPSALLAGQYCGYPQAQLFEEASWQSERLDETPFSKLAESREDDDM